MASDKGRDLQHDQVDIAEVQAEFTDCSDINYRSFPDINVEIVYFGHLVGNEELERDVVQPLATSSPDEVAQVFERGQYKRSTDVKELVDSILAGKAAIFYKQCAYLADVYGPAARPVTQSETETIITGPHDSFSESVGTNLSLIRRRVRSSHLKAIHLQVGEISKTDVYVLYIKDIADQEYVDELIKRIKNIKTDAIYDTNMLVQYIDEFPNSIFPQFLTTERPDVIASKINSGRVIGLMDSSPSAFSAPTSFFEFFSSPDDHYQRWAIGSALRVLRFLAFVIAITFTAVYVSITTFHYEMIPNTLLLNIASSRNQVPFPPLFEAFLMEITIELLREAGARLPTKIGQTIGIVGGIVIGQASVTAGLTSNILIIAVALSAIASFVIPSYIMSASIRLLRFGLILLAGIWGNLGLMVGIALIVIHLSGLTNLRTSYLTPLAPMNISDWKDTFVRFPFWGNRSRPSISKTPNAERDKTKI